MKKSSQVVKYIILSIFALILILLIGFIGHSKVITLLDKLIVGIIFILSLLFGISLSISPGWYKKQKNEQKIDTKNKTTISFEGHHPNCVKFAGHRITIKNNIYCAGCLGLIIGSIITIILIIIYILSDVFVINFHILLLLGIFIILILLVIIIFYKRNPFIRFLSNTFFVISFFIIIISILEITGDFIYGLLTGLFTFLLIHTRIHISKWTHQSICRNCRKECKMF